MTRQNQIIALVKGAKGDAERVETDAYHRMQKPALFTGIRRTYETTIEGGEMEPDESTRVQVNAEALLQDVADRLTRMFDLVATMDATNCIARADVVVDGQTLLRDVPANTLVFLDKQMTRWRNLLTRAPVQDPADRWDYDQDEGAYATQPVLTNRRVKAPKTLVKWEPPGPEYTQPAQTEVYYVDEVVGRYTNTKLSGAMPPRRVREMRERVDRLAAAVKVAVQEANAAEADDRRGVGAAVFGYLLG